MIFRNGEIILNMFPLNKESNNCNSRRMIDSDWFWSHPKIDFGKQFGSIKNRSSFCLFASLVFVLFFFFSTTNLLIWEDSFEPPPFSSQPQKCMEMFHEKWYKETVVHGKSFLLLSLILLIISPASLTQKLFPACFWCKGERRHSFKGLSPFQSQKKTDANLLPDQDITSYILWEESNDRNVCTESWFNVQFNGTWKIIGCVKYKQTKELTRSFAQKINMVSENGIHVTCLPVPACHAWRGEGFYKRYKCSPT